MHPCSLLLLGRVPQTRRMCLAWRLSSSTSLRGCCCCCRVMVAVLLVVVALVAVVLLRLLLLLPATRCEHHRMATAARSRCRPS